MIEIIEQKIKELYGSKALFCEDNGHKYKNFASKLRTIQSKVKWLNELIKPLGLKVEIRPLNEKQ
jgi:hypothetical protein